MNLYPLDPLPSFTHYKNFTLIPKNQVYSACFSFSGTLFWINLLHLSASFHRSHRNLSIFQICLKVAIISNVLMSAMTRWKETETALQSKPCLLKELVTKMKKKLKIPNHPLTIALNIYQFSRCLFSCSSNILYEFTEG